jgi:peptidylprolyl isomerase
LQISDSKVGTGATPKETRPASCTTGWLYENGAKAKFDSSVDRGQPSSTARRVIAGWDEGVATMKVGGNTLIIPPALGYGARGAGGVGPTPR